MIRARVLVLTAMAGLLSPWGLIAADQALPRFGEEIFVFAEAPFVTPVGEGQPVAIRFGVGEMEIESTVTNEV